MPSARETEPPPRRFALGLGHAVFLIAAGVRLLALLRLTRSSLLIPSRGDMHFYNDWARQILHGQFTQHVAFYGLPGYAYFLAILGRLFGENPFVPGLLQALVDSFTAVLIYQLFVTLFGTKFGSPDQSDGISVRLAGALAAVGWAFFVPAEAYSIILMPTAWFVFVFWFVVWRLIRCGFAPAASELLVLAVVIGITATAVATILALVPLVLAALVFKQGRDRWQYLIGRIGILALGLAIGTSPCWIHNFFIVRDPVVLSAHSGINFWIGNNPEANGYPRFPPGLRAGQAAMLQDSIDQAEAAAGHSLKRAEISAYWSHKAKEFIHDHFRDWLKLVGLKIHNFWSAFQYDDLSVITILREQNVIFPGIYFGLIAALAIPGIIVSWLKAPRSRWVAAAVLLSMFALLPVFITERYRLVAAPGLLILAAFGLLSLWQKLASRELTFAGIYVALVLFSTVLVAWPQRDPSLWALDAYNAGWQALESNNLALAERKLATAYAYVPQNSETLFALGNLRFAKHNPSAAQSFYRAVLNLDPKHKGAFNNLGVIALETSQFDEAEKWFRHAEDVDPRNGKTHFLLAKALLAKNERAAAQTEIELAIELQPNQSEFTALKQEIERNSP